MKKTYSVPIIEKLEFDYRHVILTSGEDIHGDWGNGRGCGRVVTRNGINCGKTKNKNC